MRSFLMVSAVCAAAFALSACAGVTTPSSLGSTARAPDAAAYGDYLSARLAASEHDLPDAAQLFREGLARDPGNADLLDHAFLYTAANGDVEEAAVLAGQVVAQQPDNRAARPARLPSKRSSMATSPARARRSRNPQRDRSPN